MSPAVINFCLKIKHTNTLEKKGKNNNKAHSKPMAIYQHTFIPPPPLLPPPTHTKQIIFIFWINSFRFSFYVSLLMAYGSWRCHFLLRNSANHLFCLCDPNRWRRARRRRRRHGRATWRSCAERGLPGRACYALSTTSGCCRSPAFHKPANNQIFISFRANKYLVDI